MNNLMKTRMVSATTKVKALLSEARRFTVGLDIWTNKGLTASFLGISAAFFHPPTCQPLHIFLNLYQIPHPHTGTLIADRLMECLRTWAIEPKQVLMFITDKGSNMIKGVNEVSRQVADSSVAKESEAEDTGESADETQTEIESETDGEVDVEDTPSGRADAVSESEDEAGDGDEEEIDLQVGMRRFPCIAHTLQLVVKVIEKHEATAKLILKSTKVVNAVRKSSVATQRLLEKAGKTLVKCNATRWNSTLFMIQRLLEIRQPLNEVLDSMQIDGLLASEWSRLEELCKLLKPIQCHTDTLQSDNMVLSNVLPSLIDLCCHFQEPDHPRVLALPLLKSLRQRFGPVFDTQDLEFDALAVAACYLDPTVAVTLLSPDSEALLRAAQLFIRQMLTNAEVCDCYLLEILLLKFCTEFIVLA